MTNTAGNSFPRYTTYAPGAMEEEVRRYLRVPDGASLPSGATEADLRNGNSVGAGGRRASAQVRRHGFTVLLPDGTEGACNYERQGPALHKFEFKDAAGEPLPRQWHTHRLDGTAADVVRAGREIAAAAFREAIERERRDYFCRASESPSRKKRLDRFQMSAKRAKELAGRYALCLRLGSKLLPMTGESFAKLDEANVAWWKWRESLSGTPDYATSPVVGCCNRLDRCWELPRYNPLYAETGRPVQGEK